MNASPKAFVSLLLLLSTVAEPMVAQQTPPATAAASGERDLYELEQLYAKEKIEKVEEPFSTAMERLTTAYQATLDEAFKKAAAEGRLDETLALQNELKEFTEKGVVPAVDRPDTIPSVVKPRTAYRAEAARVAAQQKASAQKLAGVQFERLRALERELTKALKLEEAKAVRAEIVSLTPLATTPAVATPPSVTRTAPPTVAANAQKAPPNPPTVDDPSRNPIGTWIFKMEGGPSFRRTFHDNGTITGEGLPRPGTWKVTSTKIIINYPQGAGWMALPLNPKGTKAQSHGGQTQIARKLES